MFTVCVAGSLHSSKLEQTHREWLLDRIKEAKSVTAGMSRADLLKVFEEDGGLNTIPARRYVLRSCPYIKVDVEFNVKPRSYTRDMPDQNLKIQNISEPYLGYMITD
jgi:hypothetical protein